MAFEPVEGLTGKRLPAEDFPHDLRCPGCPGKDPFKTVRALRGHAAAKHGIKWHTSNKNLAATTIAKRKEFGARALDPTRPELPEDLSMWHKFAVLWHELRGYTIEEVADHLGKTPEGVRKIFRSPAGQQFAAWVREKASSPQNLAKWVINSNAPDAAVDMLVAKQWAMASKDHDAVHRISRDVLKAAGGFQHDPDADPGRTIRIVLDTGDLDTPAVKTSYEVLEAEVIDE